MSIILRFFPNGEFSQGVALSSKRPPHHICNKMQTSIRQEIITNADLQRCKEQYADIPSQTYANKGYVFAGHGGTKFTLNAFDEKTTHLVLSRADGTTSDVHCNTSIYRLVHLKLLTPLGLSDARILTNNGKSRKKLLSMTSNMARNLRNAIYLLEEKYGKEQLSFLTLTLPNLSTEGLASCCANWDVMVNSFTKWLRSRVEYKCIELEYGYCTEIQQNRLKNRGEYAPHLHIVFRGKAYNKQPWAVSWLDCRNAWIDIISKYVDEQFDTRALENIQRVKKSASRYLSKYLSKGKQSIPEQTDKTAPIQQLHTQWGGMSRKLSQSVKRRIVRMSSASGSPYSAYRFFSAIPLLIQKGIIKYFSTRFIPTGVSRATGLEQGIHVGVGALASPTDKILHVALQIIEDFFVPPE